MTVHSITTIYDNRLHWHTTLSASAQRPSLVIHPPSNEGKRAFSKHATFTYKAAPYLERNRNIVNRCQLLVATPGGMSEELRSGTWFTVRYARKIKRPIVLVYPDGTTEKVAGSNTDPLHELRQ